MISVWIKEEVRVAELPVPKTGEIVYDEVFSHMHLGCDPDFCDDLPADAEGADWVFDDSDEAAIGAEALALVLPLQDVYDDELKDRREDFWEAYEEAAEGGLSALSDLKKNIPANLDRGLSAWFMAEYEAGGYKDVLDEAAGVCKRYPPETLDGLEHDGEDLGEEARHGACAAASLRNALDAANGGDWDTAAAEYKAAQRGTLGNALGLAEVWSEFSDLEPVVAWHGTLNSLRNLNIFLGSRIGYCITRRSQILEDLGL